MTVSSLKNLLEKNNNELIVIGSKFCSKCKSLERVLEANNVVFIKVDALEFNPKELDDLEIFAIPTVCYKGERLYEPSLSDVLKLIEGT